MIKTVKDNWDMTCPKCGKDDRIEVAISAWVLLTHDGTDHDEAEDLTHEWDDGSQCQCQNCSYVGVVADFKICEE